MCEDKVIQVGLLCLWCLCSAKSTSWFHSVKDKPVRTKSKTSLVPNQQKWRLTPSSDQSESSFQSEQRQTYGRGSAPNPPPRPFIYGYVQACFWHRTHNFEHMPCGPSRVPEPQRRDRWTQFSFSIVYNPHRQRENKELERQRFHR